MAEHIEIGDEMKEVLAQDAPAKVDEPAKSIEDAAAPKEGDPDDKNDTPEQLAEKHKNRVSAKDRIREFRRKLGDKERELEAANQELERFRAGGKPAEDAAPKEEDYGTPEEYFEAVTDYKADLKLKKTLKDNEAKQAEARQKEAAAKIQSDWSKQQAKAIEKYPDFKEMENDLIEDIQDLGAVNLFDDILEADHGTEIVAYLHKHPDELERIASLRPRAATREIGKLEIQLAEKPVKKSPPPPPETIRGSAPVIKDVHRLSQEEYNRKKNGF